MSMNAAVRVGDPVGHSVSQSLFGEAQAAKAVYDTSGECTPPPGYRNATPEDLQRLCLTEAMLEHPSILPRAYPWSLSKARRAAPTGCGTSIRGRANMPPYA
ncbi:hypothetical protein [Sphingomonas parapaucimobilis]